MAWQFDEALDAGTPSGGGGDIEMFHRIVQRGFTLVYEPKALVWHTHRRDLGSLRKLMNNNGRGFGAYLLTCMHNRTVGRLSVLSFALRDWFVGWILPRLIRPGGLPRQFVVQELLGALSSPIAFMVSRIRARRIVLSASERPQPEARNHSVFIKAPSKGQNPETAPARLEELHLVNNPLGVNLES